MIRNREMPKGGLTLFNRFFINLKWFKKALFMWVMRFWGYRFKSAGKHFFCLGTSSFFEGETITVGDYVFINCGAYLTGNVNIGHFVQIAANVAIVGGDHDFTVAGVPLEFAGLAGKNDLVTNIGDDVWIGHGATILGGVTIGRGAIVGAGSVVVSDVAPYAVIVGNPARKIRDRFSSDEQFIHNKSLDSLARCSNAEYRSFQLMDERCGGHNNKE